jgi:hypothetical protein
MALGRSSCGYFVYGSQSAVLTPANRDKVLVVRPPAPGGLERSVT